MQTELMIEIIIGMIKYLKEVRTFPKKFVITINKNNGVISNNSCFWFIMSTSSKFEIIENIFMGDSRIIRVIIKVIAKYR